MLSEHPCGKESPCVAYTIYNPPKRPGHKTDDDDRREAAEFFEQRAYFTPYDQLPRSMAGHSGASQIVANNRHALWIPNFLENGERLTIFIPGFPGAGKSYLSKLLLRQFPKKYNILLFTDLSENDGNFTEFLTKDVPKDDEHPDGKEKRLFKVTLTPENLSKVTLDSVRRLSPDGVVMIFDDVDMIRNSKVRSMVDELMQNVLTTGRGHEKHDGNGDIHVIVTSHALHNYNKTKTAIENSEYIALFPCSTLYSQYVNMFKKIGLPLDLCDATRATAKQEGIRQVIIRKTDPMYVICGPYIYLPYDDD